MNVKLTGSKKCARSNINRTDMTTQGENIGSRKVEPEKNGLPKWRLHANFLLRELARLWYGQKSFFDMPPDYCNGANFWLEFVSLFDEMAKLFGKEYGLAENIMDKRLREAIGYWKEQHGIKIVFASPYFEAKWRVRHMLERERADRLFDNHVVATVLILAFYAYNRDFRGEMPPHGSLTDLKPLEYYEALPVDPDLEDKYYKKSR